MTRAFVDRGRVLFSSLMEDTVVIVRPGAGGTVDPVTGDWTPGTGSTVYNGPGRVHFPNPAETNIIFGSTEITFTRTVISLPYDAPDIHVGDVATANGRTFKVTATPPPSTFNMRRQIGCEVDE